MDPIHSFWAGVKPPEFKRGSGPGALPFGAATDANRALAQTPAQAPPGVETAPPPPPETATAGPAAGGPTAPPPLVPSSEEDKWLLGPTQKPGQAVRPLYMTPPNPGTDAWVEALANAAAEPDAPGEVKRAFNDVMAWVNRTASRRG